MSKPKFKKFKVPEQILQQLYELTGSPEAYKGFIIAYVTEDGEPVIHAKCDCQITEYGLTKALETFIAESEGFPVDIDAEENT